jgi:hypothetical protein
MAIFFARAKIISRSNGQNALACAAYRSGEKLYDRTEEKEHDYSRKSGILDQGIATPEGAPEWMKDREKLWTAVEEQEKRKDSQLAREFIVAVPDGLGDKTKELTAELVKQLTDRGMVVDYALHEPNKEGDARNKHWHFETTIRPIDGDGFGKKSQDWLNRGKELDQIKDGFCQTFNRELLAKGLEPVDWRSYKEQGITDRAPQEHQGVEKTAMTRREARELARLEKQIKAKEKEIAAYDGIGKDGRNRDEAGRDERGTSRTPENDRGEKDRTRERDTSGISGNIERTIHDIEDRARRGLTADEQRTERERQTTRERDEQLKREREANERSLGREREIGGRSR